jgi:hypothetical protein
MGGIYGAGKPFNLRQARSTTLKPSARKPVRHVASGNYRPQPMPASSTEYVFKLDAPRSDKVSIWMTMIGAASGFIAGLFGGRSNSATATATASAGKSSTVTPSVTPQVNTPGENTPVEPSTPEVEPQGDEPGDDEVEDPVYTYSGKATDDVRGNGDVTGSAGVEITGDDKEAPDTITMHDDSSGSTHDYKYRKLTEDEINNGQTADGVTISIPDDVKTSGKPLYILESATDGETDIKSDHPEVYQLDAEQSDNEYSYNLSQSDGMSGAGQSSIKKSSLATSQPANTSNGTTQTEQTSSETANDNSAQSIMVNGVSINLSDLDSTAKFQRTIKTKFPNISQKQLTEAYTAYKSGGAENLQAVLEGLSFTA